MNAGDSSRRAPILKTPEVRAVVIDPNPLFVRGVASVLTDAGIKVDSTKNILDWALGPGARAVIVALSAPSARSLIVDLRSVRSDIAIVAVIEAGNPAAYAGALKIGACSAIQREAPARKLSAVVDAAVLGLSLLPVGVIRHMVRLSPSQTRPCLSSGEVATLRALANGDSVAALAERLSYSQREMHRRLRKLYDRIGASNRTHAIVLATRWGVVGVEEEDHIVIDLGVDALAGSRLNDITP